MRTLRSLALLASLAVVGGAGCSVAGGLGGRTLAHRQNHADSETSQLSSVAEYTVAGVIAGAVLDVLLFYKLQSSFGEGGETFALSQSTSIQ